MDRAKNGWGPAHYPKRVRNERTMNKWTKSVFALMTASLAVTASISAVAAKESSVSVQEESKGDSVIEKQLRSFLKNIQ